MVNLAAPNDSVSPFDATNPLSYLPPSVARELTIAAYVLVGALVIQIWDILNNVRTDYMLLTKHALKPPAVVYCVSRISTFAYLLFATMYETAPIGRCFMLSKLPPWMFMVAMSSTTLLFYFRVCAMYNNSRMASAIFFLLWLGVVGGCVPSTIGVSGAAIGPTNYCISTTLKQYVGITSIMPLIYDSAVFIAISWRLTRLNLPGEMGLGFIDKIKMLVFGKRLSKLSRVLLQDGQAYYLTTVVFNLSVLIIFYIDSIPLVYRTLLGLPEFMLMNVMACRVYRRTKSGIYLEDTTFDSRVTAGPMVFGISPASVPQRSGNMPSEGINHISLQPSSDSGTNINHTSQTLTRSFTKKEEVLEIC